MLYMYFIDMYISRVTEKKKKKKDRANNHAKEINNFISCDIHKPSSLDSDTNYINQFMLMKFFALINPT